MMRRTPLLAAALVSLTVPVTGDSSEPVDADDAVPGLEMDIEFPRYLQVAGERVEVVFVNGSDEALLVERLAIRSPAFEELPTEDKDFVVSAGRRFDLHVELGDVRCEFDPEGSAVEVAVVHGDRPWEGSIAVDDTTLRRIWEDRCTDLDIASTVDVGFSDDFERDDDQLETALTADLLEPGAWARIEAMRGSVILTISLNPMDDGSLVAVDGESPSAAAPVTITASRCESHAVIESKKTFEFGVWVSTAEYEAEHIVVRPTGPLLVELEAMIRDCIERTATPD